VVTNGHGDLINKRPIAPELEGLIDRISVSLNTDTEERYDRVCKPGFGRGTYQAIQRFVRSAVSSGIAVEVTCLDLPGVDISKCKSIASTLGATFRLRRLGAVG
jgi:TatD DNase family protein